MSQNAATISDMALLQGFTSAYAAGRAARPTTTRTPLTIRAGRAAARLLPRWATIRTALLTTSGLGAIDAGLWHIHLVAGLIGIGVSLLILEALGGKA